MLPLGNSRQTSEVNWKNHICSGQILEVNTKKAALGNSMQILEVNTKKADCPGQQYADIRSNTKKADCPKQH